MTIHHEPVLDSGAPGMTLRLAEAFRDFGHDVTVLSFADCPPGLPEVAKMVAFPLLVAGRLAALQFCQPVDVVDASSGDAALFAYVRNVFPRSSRPLLVTRSHGLEHAMHEALIREVDKGAVAVGWKYFLYHGGLKLRQVAVSLRKADLVLLLNESDARYATSHLGVSRHRIRLVANGISARLLRDPPSADLATDELVRLAHVGTFSARKGVTRLARELTAVMRGDSRVYVGLYGTGVDDEVVRERFPLDVRDRLTIVSCYANAELRTLLAAHQIVVSASTFEGFNVGVVEGMACGLAPVVASTAVADGIIVEGESGIIVESTANGALQHAIEVLTRNPEMLAKMRCAAAARAQKFAWPAIARDQLSLYAVTERQ